MDSTQWKTSTRPWRAPAIHSLFQIDLLYSLGADLHRGGSPWQILRVGKNRHPDDPNDIRRKPNPRLRRRRILATRLAACQSSYISPMARDDPKAFPAYSLSATPMVSLNKALIFCPSALQVKNSPRGIDISLTNKKYL